jgi:hypothetical protein
MRVDLGWRRQRSPLDEPRHLRQNHQRRLLGVVNEFALLGDVHRLEFGADDDLVALSVRLAETPLSSLDRRHHSPDQELRHWSPGYALNS